jgi:adenylate kinase
MQILFLGAPGAGKGTQCKRLSRHLDLPHLSSGDLLREAVKLDTPAGQMAKSFMDKGVLVPDHVLIDMFREKLKSAECQKGFILDGFPRNVAQAKSLNELLVELNRELTIVINVQVDPKILTARICGRRVCSNKACNAPYHIEFAKPKQDNICDLCGAHLTTRSDDNVDLVEARLNTYYKETEPLIEYYDSKLLLRTIDGEGDQDAIFADILMTLNVLTH